jgi:hypothetical protein
MVMYVIRALTLHSSVFALVFCFFASCTSRYSDFFPYYDNGTKKPSLVLLPMISDPKSLQGKDPLLDGKICADEQDAAKFCENVSKSVRNRLKRKGTTYVPPDEKIKKVLQKVSVEALSDDTSLSLFKKFQGCDYVCLMELVDVTNNPYKRGAFTPLYFAQIPIEEARVLSIAVRMKIVDIRPQTPKIVRQELIQSNHMVLLPLEPNARDLVQSRLSRDLALKIEDTLCSRK